MSNKIQVRFLDTDVLNLIQLAEDNANAYTDGEIAGVQAEIAALATGLNWRPSVRALTADAGLNAAADGTSLASLLPFSDDEGTALTIADFAADHFLLSKGATCKLFIVYDDAGTLKVTQAGVDPLAEGFTFLVRHDLVDTPAAQENHSLWVFSGGTLVKVGDFDWGVADGIDLTVGYAPTSGAVTGGDAVETAIGKLDFARAALVTEDLTFLKLDGTRNMTGTLKLGAGVGAWGSAVPNTGVGIYGHFVDALNHEIGLKNNTFEAMFSLYDASTNGTGHPTSVGALFIGTVGGDTQTILYAQNTNMVELDKGNGNPVVRVGTVGNGEILYDAGADWHPVFQVVDTTYPYIAFGTGAGEPKGYLGYDGFGMELGGYLTQYIQLSIGNADAMRVLPDGTARIGRGFTSGSTQARSGGATLTVYEKVADYAAPVLELLAEGAGARAEPYFKIIDTNIGTIFEVLGNGQVSVGGRVVNMPDPVDPQDAATKAYVDAATPNFNKYNYTLLAGDITNQYIDLPHEVVANSLDVVVEGAVQEEGLDYTLSVVGSVTRITFAGDLATGGGTPLVAGDRINTKYVY